MTTNEELIKVEVVYALPESQSLLTIDVASGSTVEEAIRQSGIMERYPDIDLSKNMVGIWSKKTSLDQELKANDRVEIYRPLIADPKEARKKRAEKKE